MRSYIIHKDMGVITRRDHSKADEVLTDACSENRCHWWGLDVFDSDEGTALIETNEEELLEDLRGAGWVVKPAAAGVYEDQDGRRDALVIGEGGEVLESPKIETK